MRTNPAPRRAAEPTRIRNLETRRAALVRELATVNSLLRKARPVVRGEEDWDFDPRSVSL